MAELESAGTPRGWTEYPAPASRSLRTSVVGWLLFGVALGIGVLIGWAIWGV